MEFIATYWWIWLIGLLICGSVGLLKWFMNFFSTFGLAIKATKLTSEGLQTARDKDRDYKQKALHVKDRALEEALNEGVGRLKGFGLTLAFLFAAWGFGIMLILSVVINLIDYIKA